MDEELDRELLIGIQRGRAGKHPYSLLERFLIWLGAFSGERSFEKREARMAGFRQASRMQHPRESSN